LFFFVFESCLWREASAAPHTPSLREGKGSAGWGPHFVDRPVETRQQCTFYFIDHAFELPQLITPRLRWLLVIRGWPSAVHPSDIWKTCMHEQPVWHIHYPDQWIPFLRGGQRGDPIQNPVRKRAG